MNLRLVLFSLVTLTGQASVVGQATAAVTYFDERHQQSMTWTPTGRDATVPGEVRTPYPTLHHLAVEWEIEGDDNLNGVVSVRYRRVGTAGWNEAMPLQRVPAMVYDSGDQSNLFRWANKHSGSILDLEPATEYEIELRLADPDGGAAEHTIRARTRPVPAAMPHAPIKRVTPATLAQAAAAARPGDVLLLAPGNYGFFAAPVDGAPGRPIVFRADPFDYRERDLAPDNRGGHRTYVLFNGFSLQNRRHVQLEGILSRNTIDLFNAESCAVIGCTVQAVWGIISSEQGLSRWLPEVYGRLQPTPNDRLYLERESPRRAIPPHMTNCYIADNVIIGATPWWPGSIHANGKNLGEGIQISGPGNVICHNRVSGFRDCISLMEGRYAWEQRCIDICDNEVSEGADDGIEADYAADNCRILRNRLTNCMRGIALAPVLGGPAYVIRNVLYNTENVWQLGRMGAGYVVLHNTSVKSGSGITVESHLGASVHNNLFLAGGPEAEAVVTRGKTRARCVYDYNGYGVMGGPFRGNIDGQAFASEQELRARTSERHGVEVDLGIFAAPVALPAGLFPARAPADLRLRPGGKAVDAGRIIANANDHFTGKAPDLGAYELGQPVPVYGPRWAARE